jgi:hypothetical protein
MPSSTHIRGASEKLNLRVGDLVEVRSQADILATLDEHGRFDSLPFMPEMLQYCGKRFRVFKRVDKACDTIVRDGIRRMYDTVLLDNLRCDGTGHGGCQASCTIMWKEAWLKPVSQAQLVDLKRPEAPTSAALLSSPACSPEFLFESACKSAPAADPDGSYYSCQATELRGATSHLTWWDPRQYWRDIRSGNVGVWPLIRSFGIWVFNRIQTYRRGGKYPFIEGKLKRTPALDLNLQPGELVQLRPKGEILETLDVNDRNRGLSFDRELVKYCGGTYRVRRRVDCVLDEKTGKLIRLTTPAIILEGVTCTGDYNRYCPRDIYHFVREIWLRRLSDPNSDNLPPSPAGNAYVCPSPCVSEEEKSELQARP